MTARKRRLVSTLALLLPTLLCALETETLAILADEVSLSTTVTMSPQENQGRVCDAFPDESQFGYVIPLQDSSNLSITEMSWANQSRKPSPAAPASSQTMPGSRFQLAASSRARKPMTVGGFTKVFQPAKPHVPVAEPENVLQVTEPSIVRQRRWSKGLAPIKIDDLKRKSVFPTFERIDKRRGQFKFPFRVFLLPLVSLGMVLCYHQWLKRFRHPRYRYFY